jgi:hypothetical protein
MGFFDNRVKDYDFDPLEETFGLEGMGEREIDPTIHAEAQAFGLQPDVQTVDGVPVPQAERFEFDPEGTAETEFDRSASAERPMKTGAFGKLSKNEKIGMILRMVAAGAATFASKDPSATAVKFIQMGQDRYQAAQQREHELRTQDREFTGSEKLQAQAQAFAGGESEKDRAFKFEFQTRDADYVMNRVLEEQGFDLRMEKFRQSQAWKRLGSEQMAQLNAAAFNQAMAIFPEGDMEGASKWARCASSGENCSDPLVEQFAQGINKNVQIQRSAERAQIELQRMEQIRLSPVGTRVNDMTGSIEPIPATIGQITTMTQAWSDGMPVEQISGVLVQDAETVLNADQAAGLEAVIKDGDRSKVPSYIGGIRTIAESEGRKVTDYTMVRQMNERVNVTRDELADAGVYGGDKVTLSKALVNSDIEQLIAANPKLLMGDENALLTRVAAGITARGSREGWDSVEINEAIKSGLSRVLMSRYKVRGIQIGQSVLKHITNMIHPRLYEAAAADMHRIEEGIDMYKDSQF